MRAAWMLALALSLPSAATAATIEPSATATATIDAAEAWRPMRPFMGSWKGTRTGSDKSVKVSRDYFPATTNHHLEIKERGAVWGVVSFDPQKQVLVMRQFDADGTTSDVVLNPAAASSGPIVFASPESEAKRTRITYEIVSPKAFVERIERAAGNEAFAVVAETRFERKN